jgi:hypothetical protein
MQLLVAPANFAALAAGRGAEFHPLPFDAVKRLHEPETEALFSAGSNPIVFLRWLDKTERKSINAFAPAAREGAKGADLVVATGLMDELGSMLAERLKIPCVHGWCEPMLAARDFLFASGESAPPRFPGSANRAIFRAYEEAMWLVTRRVLCPARHLYALPRRALRRCGARCLSLAQQFTRLSAVKIERRDPACSPWTRCNFFPWKALA